MARKYTAEQLFDVIEEISKIVCSKCGYEDIKTGNAETAPNDFFESGWRVTAAQIAYCPKCTVKYLKLPDNPWSRENMKNKFIGDKTYHHIVEGGVIQQ
jgi:predicted nucleic-acid-binding Zn-ribbon protein